MGRPLDIEPILAIFFLTGVLLLLAVLTLYAWKKREQKSDENEVDLDELLASCRSENPAFYNIMQNYRSSGTLEGVLKRPDVQQALGELVSRKAEADSRKKKKKKDLRHPLLELSRPPRRDPAPQAAMLTILRAIYSDPKLRRRLPASADAELDALLDSLTGGGAVR